MTASQVFQSLFPMKRSVVHDDRWAFGYAFHQCFSEPIFKKFTRHILCITQRRNTLHFATWQLKLCGNNIESLKFPTTPNIFNLYATNRPASFTNKWPVDATFIGVNPFFLRYLLYFFEVSRSGLFGLFGVGEGFFLSVIFSCWSRLWTDGIEQSKMTASSRK